MWNRLLMMRVIRRMCWRIWMLICLVIRRIGIIARILLKWWIRMMWLVSRRILIWLVVLYVNGTCKLRRLVLRWDEMILCLDRIILCVRLLLLNGMTPLVCKVVVTLKLCMRLWNDLRILSWTTMMSRLKFSRTRLWWRVVVWLILTWWIGRKRLVDCREFLRKTRSRRIRLLWIIVSGKCHRYGMVVLERVCRLVGRRLCLFVYALCLILLEVDVLKLLVFVGLRVMRCALLFLRCWLAELARNRNCRRVVRWLNLLDAFVNGTTRSDRIIILLLLLIRILLR